jgi:hypothetical protein
MCEGLESTAAVNQEAGDLDRQVGWRRLQALLQLALILIVHPLPSQGLAVLSLTLDPKKEMASAYNMLSTFKSSFTRSSFAGKLLYTNS